jgi:Flp pilus assembly protein TadB
MKMKKNNAKIWLYAAGIAAGAGLLLAGVLLNDSVAKEVTGVCVGLGAGLLGMFTANLINTLIEAKHPEASRIKNIEVNDERNAAIRDRAGARANRLMAYIIPVMALIFALMGVQLAAILILCGLVLLQAFVTVYFIGYFNKRM